MADKSDEQYKLGERNPPPEDNDEADDHQHETLFIDRGDDDDKQPNDIDLGPSNDPDDIRSVPVPPGTEEFRSESTREKRVTFNRVFRTPICKSDSPSFFDRQNGD